MSIGYDEPGLGYDLDLFYDGDTAVKKQTWVFCSRCEGNFRIHGEPAPRTECPYCGFPFIVNVIVAGYNGTLRTADNTGDASAATGITVT